MATDKGEDNFKLTLLSIRELKAAHRRTEDGLQEVSKGLQAALAGIDHVAEAQAQARDALESLTFNCVATQKRLAEVEQRLDCLEESALPA